MATWKKVIVSGSNAELAQITSSAGIDTLSTRTDQHIAITGSATSTASFGAYIGDGSQLTGVGMDIQRVYYVSPSGDDSTGVVGSLNYPFQTISGSVVQAKADAAAGSYHVSSSVINIMPGHYFEQDLQMDGGTYYFHPGAILSPPVQEAATVKPLFTISDSIKNLKILGQGEFRLQATTDGTPTSNSKLIDGTGAGSARIEFDSIKLSGSPLALLEGTAEVTLNGTNLINDKNPTAQGYLVRTLNDSKINLNIDNVKISGSNEFIRFAHNGTGNAQVRGIFNNVDLHKGVLLKSYVGKGNQRAELEWNKLTLKQQAKAVLEAGSNGANAVGRKHVTLTGDIYLETDGTTTYGGSMAILANQPMGHIYKNFEFSNGLFSPHKLDFTQQGTVYNKSGAIPYPFAASTVGFVDCNFNIDAIVESSGSNEVMLVQASGTTFNLNLNGSIKNESGHGINVGSTVSDQIKINTLDIIADSDSETAFAITGSTGSPGKPRISGILSSNRALGANINLTGSGIFTNDTDAAQIVNASIKSSHDGGSTFTALSANPYTASFGRFEGFSASFAHVTVSGDSLLEDVITTGITKLGNDMSDKTEVTGSLNVTGSSIFHGNESTTTINPDNANGIVFDNTGGGNSDFFKIRHNGSDRILMGLGNSGAEGFLAINNSSGAVIQLRGDQDPNFINKSLHIGGTTTATHQLQVTGDAKITNGLQISGSQALHVTGSSDFTGSFSLFDYEGDGNQGLHVEMGQSTSIQSNALVLRGRDSGNSQVVIGNDKGQSGNYVVASMGSTGGGRYGIFKLRNNNANDIQLQTSDNGASYHKGSLNIGSTSTTVGPKLDVTGNIRVSTGITGSYLTADRIPFVNAQKGLIDSSNLVYDDDGGFNTGAKLTLTGDLFVSHNLTVQGTASFQHTEDLDVADRFIRMASGSTSNGDGGIAVQQTSPTDTEGFGYDSGTSRWGVTSSFDASQNALAPVAFMPVAINGTDNNPTSNLVANETKYKKAGNIYIDTDATMEEGGVWIYV